MQVLPTSPLVVSRVPRIEQLAVPGSTTPKPNAPVPEPPEAVRVRGEPKVISPGDVIITGSNCTRPANVTVVTDDDAAK
jgi:hypothetical protein